jgi:hypothetical protein
VIKITEQIEAATGVNILSGLNRPLTAENPMVAETVPPTPSAAAE